MQTLRPYQVDADAGVRKAFRNGSKAVLLVLPTGGGKTTCFAHWLMAAMAKGSYVIFLAHRRELISQASSRLVEHSVPHGVIQAGARADARKQVQVASIQSLLPRIYPVDPETASEVPRADVLVFDEAHRATSASYKKIIAKYPGAKIIGLTATPARTDGRGLGDVFDAMVEVIDVADLIDQGYLCDYVIYEGEYEAPDDGLNIIGDDYDDGEAEKRLDTDKLVGDVYKNWKARANGKRTIIFAQTRKHGRHICDVFVDAGEQFAYLDGNTPSKERDRVVGEYAAGRIMGMVNIGLFIEGFDIPNIECVVVAFMTASIIKWRQAIGRGLRPAPGKGHLIINDHGGNARHRFGGPDSPHEWSLDGRKKREAPVQPVLTNCPGGCGGIFTSRTRKCPDCGYEISAAIARAPLPSTTDGMLVEANYKIRGSEREAKRLARLAAMTEKERKAAEREQARAAKAAQAAAKLARLEEEKKFLKDSIARMGGGKLSWKTVLLRFRERFRDLEHPTGYFPGARHGVKVDSRRVWDDEEKKFKWKLFGFTFEGVGYGASAAE